MLREIIDILVMVGGPFLILGLAIAAYERGVRRSEEARREHAAEVERASRTAYAEAKRVRKDVWA